MTAGVLPAAEAAGPALRELAVASELGLRTLDAVAPLTGTPVTPGRVVNRFMIAAGSGETPKRNAP